MPFIQIRKQFQSTPPVWAETLIGPEMPIGAIDFNPLRPCGRRLRQEFHKNYLEDISIHSARVGGDTLSGVNYVYNVLFQSTPPVWAETVSERYAYENVAISIHSARVGGDAQRTGCSMCGFDFNPLRPCGRRPSTCSAITSGSPISIHSARVGGDVFVIIL